MKIRNAIAVAVLCFLGTACSAASEPIKVGTDGFYAGNITSGNKFGVSVGSKRSDAQKILKSQGIEYYGEDQCGGSISKTIECNIGEKLDVYRMHGVLRSGFVYIFVNGGVVGKIAWRFSYAVDM